MSGISASFVNGMTASDSPELQQPRMARTLSTSIIFLAPLTARLRRGLRVLHDDPELGALRLPPARIDFLGGQLDGP